MREILIFITNRTRYYLAILSGKRRFVQKNSKIVIIFSYQYQARYLIDCVREDPRFVFRHSRNGCDDADTSIPMFDCADPQTLNVVLIDVTNIRIEGFTRHHRLLLRMQHSPGFGISIFLYLYEKLKRYNAKLMIPAHIWDLSLQCQALDANTKRIRDLIIKDGTPVLFTYYDPQMNKIFNFPNSVARKIGTLLVAFNFRIIDSYEDVKQAIKAIDFLRDKFKITVLFHPMITPANFKPASVARQMKDYLDKHMIRSLPAIRELKELVNLYDEHEFILTDGSGSAYEAIVRGCKALTLDGLTYQHNSGPLSPARKLELLPMTLVWDYKSYPGIEYDMKLVHRFYGRSLVKDDITPFIRQEIIDAFDNWDTTI